jgi:hypothetical protein
MAQKRNEKGHEGEEEVSTMARSNKCNDEEEEVSAMARSDKHSDGEEVSTTARSDKCSNRKEKGSMMARSAEGHENAQHADIEVNSNEEQDDDNNQGVKSEDKQGDNKDSSDEQEPNLDFSPICTGWPHKDNPLVVDVLGEAMVEELEEHALPLVHMISLKLLLLFVHLT